MHAARSKQDRNIPAIRRTRHRPTVRARRKVSRRAADGFFGNSAGDQFAACVRRRRVGSAVGSRGGLGWAGRRVAFRSGLVRLGDVKPVGVVAGGFVGRDEGLGRCVCGVAAPNGYPRRAGGRPGLGGGRGVRGGVCRDGASGVGRGQSRAVDGYGAVKRFRAARSDHRGARGRVRADVGPGCGRDGGISRGGFDGWGPTDAVAAGAGKFARPGLGLIQLGFFSPSRVLLRDVSLGARPSSNTRR